MSWCINVANSNAKPRVTEEIKLMNDWLGDELIVEARAMILSEQALKKIDRELKEVSGQTKRQSAVMAALAIAQDETNWLSPEVMQFVADYIGMPAVAVQEVATFLQHVQHQTSGQFKITVCTNTHAPCLVVNVRHITWNKN